MDDTGGKHEFVGENAQKMRKIQQVIIIFVVEIISEAVIKFGVSYKGLRSLMNLLMLVTDLNKPGQNFNKLYATLEMFDHIRATDSQYIIYTKYNLHQVGDLLFKITDENDAFTVCDVLLAKARLPKHVWEWLSKRTQIQLLPAVNQ